MQQQDSSPEGQNGSGPPPQETKPQKIFVRDAQPDMVLVKPVLDQKDRIVVNQGVKLTSLYINKLKKWQVETVVIDGRFFDREPDKDSSEKILAYDPGVDSKRDPEEDRLLELRFSNVIGDEKMFGLMLLSKKHLLGIDVDPQIIPELVKKMMESA